MTPKLFTAVLLFISAYSPFFLILAVKDFDYTLKSKYLFNNPIPIWILLGITLISVFILFAVIHYMKSSTYNGEIISVKNRSVDLIGYTIPYMVSFFGMDLNESSDVISMCIFMLILLVLTLSSKSIFMNPMLALIGYGLYDIEYKFDKKIYSTVVLSKLELDAGKKYYMRSITRFLYLVIEEKA